MLSRSFHSVLLGASVCALCISLTRCSGDKDPSPIGPAGKAQDDSLFDLFGSFETQADSVKSTEKPDTTVETQGVDVVIDTLWASIDRGAPGSLFTLWTRLRNQGNAIADSLTVRFYLSNNATITPGDDELANLPIASLPAGSQDTLEVELALSTRDVSINFFGACVDSVAGEQATDNNCSPQARTVRIEIEGATAAEDTEETETEQGQGTNSDTTTATTIQPDIPQGDPSQRFNITLAFTEEVPQEARLIFQRAARRWEEVVVGDMPDTKAQGLHYSARGGGHHSLAPQGTHIDDIHITVFKGGSVSYELWGYDGYSVGSAAYLEAEESGPEGYLRTIIGSVGIEFDDVELIQEYRSLEHPPSSYEAYESGLYYLAMHEIGHLLDVPPGDALRISSSGRQFVTSPNAKAQFKLLLGGVIWNKPGVPIDTDLAHWDGHVLFEDVMGGFLPLISRVSAGLLQDIGHTVNLSATDPITVYPQESAAKQVVPRRPPLWCELGR